MPETALRIADTVLAIIWAVVLVHTLRSGFLGPRTSLLPTRRTRPILYWFMTFIFALMAVHFAGLAITGQKL